MQSAWPIALGAIFLFMLLAPRRRGRGRGTKNIAPSAADARSGVVGEARVAAVLASIPGLRSVGGFVFTVPGKPDWTVQIDHVVLGARCLVTVETKNWRGPVHAPSDVGDWIVPSRSGSIRRHSPVAQGRLHAEALQILCGVPVVSLVVMAGGYLDGREDPVLRGEVVRLADLVNRLRPLLAAPGYRSGRSVEFAWTRVVAEVNSTDQPVRLRRHLARIGVTSKSGFPNGILIVGAAIVIVFLAWFADPTAMQYLHL